MTKKIILTLLLALITPITAHAEDPVAITAVGVWEGYQFTENDVKTCYMISAPRRSEGVTGARDDVFMFLTHKPRQKQFDVISFDAGYPYEKGSKATLHIGEKTINLSTSSNIAWAEDVRTDRDMVDALKNAADSGDEVSLRGTSSRQQRTKDIYSLNGFNEVYKAITAACK